MVLNDFRTIDVTWDKASQSIYQKIQVSSGDARGRKLVVQILNNGQLENANGKRLFLGWKSAKNRTNGLDPFSILNIEKGIFELYFTTGMLSNVGEISAWLKVMDNIGTVESLPFTILIHKGIDKDAIESSDSFSALDDALRTVVELKADGTIAYIQENAIGNKELKDGSVTIEKLDSQLIDFKEKKYENLFSQAKIEDGIVAANNAILKPYNDWKIASFPVKTNETYSLMLGHLKDISKDNHGILYADDNNNILGLVINSTHELKQFNGKDYITFTVPSNATKIIWTIKWSTQWNDMNDAYIFKANTINDEVLDDNDQHYGVLAINKFPLIDIYARQELTKFVDGRKLVTFGDSITWYDGKTFYPATKEPGKPVKGYQSYIREQLNMNVDNQGLNGGTMNGIKGIVTNYNFNDTDIVTFYLGMNDYRDYAVRPSYGEVKPIGSNFDNTLCGALQASIEHILKMKNDCVIGLIATHKGWYRPSANRADMTSEIADKVLEISELYKLPYLDLYHNSGIDHITEKSLIADTDVDFRFHLTNKGYERVSRMITDFVRGI
ncbi:SGNH/GDSL hydrolase family protein [Aerococcus viridans]|uniref:SGNH/GDSL hydrolase family protein n=1 Tax=Aerococcus viridans TaxID=1377 RepID=UPI00223C05A7|nr:SGNH/GDSL hydrolase family protein [Aerococcus viridans]MCT1797429.1 GDSL-type esterase/lipase family protein [Aerococcus viridans]